MNTTRCRITIAIIALAAGGCIKGPNYHLPSAPVPQSYKEAPPAGWKEAQPNDGVIRGKWWEMFNDPTLNGFEEQVSLGNQNVAMAEARYRQAQAAIRVARSALFPTVSTSPGATASQSSSRAGTAHFAPSGVIRNYSFPFDASWAPDLWGSTRRNIASDVDLAQAANATVENVKLLYQSDLAMDYFQLRGDDREIAVLQETIAQYREYLTLTRNRFAGGVATDADVAQAETQLYTTQTQLTDLGVARAQTEHAMAILIGKAPADFSVAAANVPSTLPVIPTGVPTSLLERRPDIANAERTAASSNELIGVAKAAFFPALTLSATAGFQSSSFLNWITWPSRFWSLGPQFAEILFDAGKRSAQVQSAMADYDANVASYRQTVLGAFQEVEDYLAALRILEQESSELDQAIHAAQRSLDVSSAQYKAGTATYLQVIIAQAALLANQRSAVTLLERRLTASVQLIQALGGGWDRSRLTS